MGLVVAALIFAAIESGMFASATSTFGGWYTDRVSGMLNVTVTSTTVQLPHPGRSDLPLVAYPPAAVQVPTDGGV